MFQTYPTSYLYVIKGLFLNIYKMESIRAFLVLGIWIYAAFLRTKAFARRLGVSKFVTSLIFSETQISSTDKSESLNSEIKF